MGALAQGAELRQEARTPGPGVATPSELAPRCLSGSGTQAAPERGVLGWEPGRSLCPPSRHRQPTHWYGLFQNVPALLSPITSVSEVGGHSWEGIRKGLFPGRKGSRALFSAQRGDAGEGKKQSATRRHSAGRILGWSQVTQDNKTGFLSQSGSREGGTDYKLIHEPSSAASEDQLSGSGTGFLAEGRPGSLIPAGFEGCVQGLHTGEGTRNAAIRAKPGAQSPVGRGLTRGDAWGVERPAGGGRGPSQTTTASCVMLLENLAFSFFFNKQ